MARRPRLIRYKPAPTLVTHLMGEFLGTFFFVLTISLTIQQTEAVGALAPVAIGFVFCSMVFSFGYISSAVFNPAVAIGLWVLELMDTVKTLLYIVTEVTAAVCAGFIGWFLVGDGENYKAPAPKTDKAVDIFRSGIAEFIYTFGLMSAVLHVACSRQRDNQHYGLGLGVFIAAGVFAIGGISGGAINPSVALGLQLPMCAATECRPATYFWLYWAFCIGGAVCASFVFALMHPVDVDDSDSEDCEEDEEEELNIVGSISDGQHNELGMLAKADSSSFIVFDPSKIMDESATIGADGVLPAGGSRIGSKVPSAQNLLVDDYVGVGPRRSRSAISNGGRFVFPSSASNANLSDYNRGLSTTTPRGPRAKGAQHHASNEPFALYAASSSSANTRNGDLAFVPDSTMVFEHARSRSYSPGVGAAIRGGRSRRPSVALSLQEGAVRSGEGMFFTSGTSSTAAHMRIPSGQNVRHHRTRSHQAGGIRAPNANQKAQASVSPSRTRRRSVIQMYEDRGGPTSSQSGGEDDIFTEQQYQVFLRRQQEVEENKREMIRQHLYLQQLQQQQQKSHGGSPALSAAHAGHPSLHQSQASTPRNNSNPSIPHHNGDSPKVNDPFGNREEPMDRLHAFASTAPAFGDDPVASVGDTRAKKEDEGVPLGRVDAPLGVSLNPPHYLAATLRAVGGSTPEVLQNDPALSVGEDDRQRSLDT